MRFVLSLISAVIENNREDRERTVVMDR
jgi:hypothetical protein